MFCPRCGFQLQEGAHFCGNCGAVLQAPQAAAQPAAPVKPPRSVNLFSVFLISIVVIALVVTVVIWQPWASEDGKPNKDGPTETTLSDNAVPMALDACMGYAVDNGVFTYYWQYTGEDYPDGCYMGFFGVAGTARLVRRDRSGEETVLFTAPAGIFAVTNSHIFYENNGKVLRVDLKGEGQETAGSGSIVYTDREGKYLVLNNEGTYYYLDAHTLSLQCILENGDFQACHNGVLYYTVPYDRNTESQTEYEARQQGKVILRAVNLDGSDDRLIAETASDLYNYSGISTAEIRQIRFSDTAIYFSYGSIGGSGGFYQGGKVLKVNFDGSDPQVVAGQGNLVMEDFAVNDDGSVTMLDENYIVYTSAHTDYYEQDGVVYWMDQITGKATKLVNKADYQSDVSSQANYLAYVNVWDDKAIFMVNFANFDPDQAMGWREYTVRAGTITYELDMATGELTKLYTLE